MPKSTNWNKICCNYHEKLNTVQLWKHRAVDDVETQDFYLNPNQVIFKDNIVSKMELGIKAMNKFLENG